MTTIGLSYSLVKISTKCAPALGMVQDKQGAITIVWVVFSKKIRQITSYI